MVTISTVLTVCQTEHIRLHNTIDICKMTFIYIDTYKNALDTLSLSIIPPSFLEMIYSTLPDLDI